MNGPIKFLRLNDDAKIPRRNKDSDAGFDLYATRSDTIWHGGQLVLPIGIACELPEGYVGIIKPRSGMAVKHMINVHAGVVDQGYRGEIHVCLINHGDRPVEIRKGDRIAQMLVVPFCGDSVEVDSIGDSERGSDGFGSSGV